MCSSEDAIQRAVFEHLAVRRVPTGAQLQAIAAGGRAQICRGLDHALAVLERWGLLRGRTT
jgi:hypothetical protein